MSDTIVNNVDENVMKLLHYFITVQGYNPIVLRGAENEIWLENMESDYKIVRIVSNYIHNDEQFKFDIYRTKQIVKKIKRQTLTFSVNVLCMYINLGDNVSIDNFNNVNRMFFAKINDVSDLKKYNNITCKFPDIVDIENFKEEGLDLFLKLTGDINKKNEHDNTVTTDVFKKRKPYVTYVLIVLNVIMFCLMYILGRGSEDNLTLLSFGALYKPYILNGDFYRLLVSTFLHSGIFHLLFNMYSLYILGSQMESFLGKFKFLFVYLVSALSGSLMSTVFLGNTISIGASGAIFGILGSLLYFGYNYRVYLGNVLRTQIIPILFLNLLLVFFASSIDVSAHIGGLIGGALATIACGLKYKTSSFEKVNGLIILLLYLGFLGYMVFYA